MGQHSSGRPRPIAYRLLDPMVQHVHLSVQVLASGEAHVLTSKIDLATRKMTFEQLVVTTGIGPERVDALVVLHSAVSSLIDEELGFPPL